MAMLNTRDEALALLRQYNKEPFHLLHALTVEGVMAWYAGELGYGDQADFWSMAGLLHDIDFEQWPDQHCRGPARYWSTPWPVTLTASAPTWSPSMRWRRSSSQSTS